LAPFFHDEPSLFQTERSYMGSGTNLTRPDEKKSHHSEQLIEIHPAAIERY